MSDYDNNMRGVLFKNDRKENDKHPDYKGQCEIDGEEYWLSAWIKTGAKGKFMSLSFTAKEQPKNPPARDRLQWARDLQDRDERGEPLSEAQRIAYKAALQHTEPAAGMSFAIVPDDSLPPAMRQMA